jgi:hypothetical protein
MEEAPADAIVDLIAIGADGNYPVPWARLEMPT